MTADDTVIMPCEKGGRVAGNVRLKRKDIWMLGCLEAGKKRRPQLERISEEREA